MPDRRSQPGRRRRDGARDVRAGGGDALVVRGDVTDPGDVTRLVDTVVDHWGRLDVLVHNATTPFRSPRSPT